MSNVAALLKALKHMEVNTQRRSSGQKIFKLRIAINKMETKRLIQRINKTNNWFLEKISKIDKFLAKLTERQRESILINKIRNKKGDITDDEAIQKIIRFYFKSLYSTNWDKETDDF